MPKLFIRLLSPASPADERSADEGFNVQSAWMIRESDGRIRARGETDFRGLSELIDPGTAWIQDPDNIVVTVPSEYVLSLTCQVPGRNIGQIRRALPFVVEEYVTTDIESMHLASGPLRRGAPARVDLVERDLLRGWLDCLAALSVRPGYMFSEAQLLPAAAREASLLIDGERVLIRTTDQAAALDRDNLILAVSALDVDRLRVVYGSLSDIERAQLIAAGELEIETSETADAETPLEYIATQWLGADAINLLQGEFRPTQQSNPVWDNWRSVAALAAVWIGVALLAMTTQAIYAGYRANDLKAQSEQIYRDIYPEERRVTNVRRQLQAKLGERPDDGSAGLLELLAALATVSDPRTRVQSLNYTGERSELAVDLMTGGFESLDQVKERLAGQGVNVDITSAEQADQGVRARIRLRGTGAGA
ncbi:MAG: type II secretion system protein GspL [Pseudomonadales bacterium]